ncbi:MAG: hypothetical protein ACLR0U_23165 [Enterocloster clostridioformis]
MPSRGKPALFHVRQMCQLLCATGYLPDRHQKAAYVPVYTCETVLAPFLKAGYELLFYDVSKDLTPIFDERVLDRISVVNLCGYYGFLQLRQGIYTEML